VKTYFKNAKQTNKFRSRRFHGWNFFELQISVCDDTEQTIDITQAVSMALD